MALPSSNAGATPQGIDNCGVLLGGGQILVMNAVTGGASTTAALVVPTSESRLI